MFSIFEKTKKNKPNTTKFNKKNIRKTKKMVCNPIVAGKTVSNDTCYTPKVLLSGRKINDQMSIQFAKIIAKLLKFSINYIF